MSDLIRAGGSAAAPKFHIREAMLDDLESIWSIESAVFGRDAWSRDLLCEELTAAHRHYLVLVDDTGTVCGYGGLLSVGTEGDIQTLATDERVRGNGQGRRIIVALLDEARRAGVREVFLEVRADNPVAKSLYESLGFDEIGIRPHYYQPDGIDAVVMKLNLRDRT